MSYDSLTIVLRECHSYDRHDERLTYRGRKAFLRYYSLANRNVVGGSVRKLATMFLIEIFARCKSLSKSTLP